MSSEQTAPAVLGRDSIFLGRGSEPMEDAIDFVAGELVKLGVVDDGYAAGMKQREETVSTYLGNGVALPHGTLETKSSVKGTAIVVAQYPDGVKWGESEDSAHLVIGLAAIGEDHVVVLSQLAEVLQDEELCKKLWVTDDADYLHATLSGEGSGDEISEEVTILNPAGLHARPAALIVELAKEAEAEVQITKAGKVANAKSIMSVLALGGATGDTVTVTADGPDARDVIDSVIEIMVSEEE